MTDGKAQRAQCALRLAYVSLMQGFGPSTTVQAARWSWLAGCGRIACTAKEADLSYLQILQQLTSGGNYCNYSKRAGYCLLRLCRCFVPYRLYSTSSSPTISKFSVGGWVPQQLRNTSLHSSASLIASWTIGPPVAVTDHLCSRGRVQMFISICFRDMS